MFEKIKNKLANTSKETIKTTLKTHTPEILATFTVIMLAYLCIKVNGRPVSITVNVNGGNYV